MDAFTYIRQRYLKYIEHDKERRTLEFYTHMTLKSRQTLEKNRVTYLTKLYKWMAEQPLRGSEIGETLLWSTNDRKFQRDIIAHKKQALHKI